MAYDDTFLRVTLHVNHSTDMYAAGIFLELLHTHLHRVRYFFIVVKQYFLTDYLTYEKSGRLVCQLLFVEIWRTVGQKFAYAVEQHIHTKFVLCRYWQ